MQKTFVVKTAEIKREQHIVDASNKILGRVCTEIASLLMGKHKAAFCRNADMGDIVTVINASKVLVTGKKATQKMYYRHSNYPGGFRITSYNEMMASHPDRIIQFAVDGMLPQNHLKAKMMTRLKIFAGDMEKPVVKPPKIKKGTEKTAAKKEPRPAPRKKAAPEPAESKPAVAEASTERQTEPKAEEKK
jgi:large subunit ribosomal protein L13